jgi:hypothetical protein
MQSITDKAEEENLLIYQYYGKWPFYRLFGIQEPASVLFSMGNALVHVYFFYQIQKQVPTGYFLKRFMALYACVGMNTWLWSTVFHMRDMKITELLDYFSAASLVLYSLFFAILRVYYIRNGVAIKALGVLFICLFVAHVAYLTIVTFDYTYNMYANVMVGTLQVMVWIGWYIRQRTERSDYAYLAIISGVGVSVAMSLELFDFPPLWRVFDAHSLWHLSTITLSIVWYKFLLEDAWHEVHVKPFSKRLLPT